ncbi:response regulator [Chitinophaga sp. HK235]|uniref:response regulator n=1 Tax=Chitinophaga sp. HK235 TaxID=2952571 RepID=UPI001BAAFFD8|nr:response regulator [Chitinophaga sp. HK235]
MTMQQKPYKKLLWVDDDPFFLSWIVPQVVIPHDFIVDPFLNAKYALAVWETASPDIILTNLVMPKMCGLEFIATLRLQGYSSPIVVVSNRFGEEQAALDAGADRFISKVGINGEIIVSALSPFFKDYPVKQNWYS